MKRIISALSAICIVIGSMCTASPRASAAAEDIAAYAGLLETLKITDGSAEVPDGDISRGEFTALLAAAAKVPPTEYEKRYWDVSASYEYAGEITAMTDNGFVSGYSDGSFRPKSILTGREAYIMAVCTLGYRSTAADYRAYIQKAEELELDDNVTGAMKRRDAYVLIYNMLCAKTAQTGMDKGVLNLQTGSETMLEKLYGLKYGEGVVYSVGIRTAADIAGRADYVTIGTAALKCNASLYNDYLGYRVRYFYDEDDGLVYCHKVKKQDSVTISADDITGFGEMTLKYETKNGSVRREKIPAGADFVYNGRYVDFDTQFTDSLMQPINGYIDLIDNDRDGSYDVVYIHECYDMVVQTVRKDDDGSLQITGKNNGSVSVSGAENCDFALTDAEGNKKDVSELYRGDVITVYKSLDENVISIILSDEKFEGSIQRADSSDERFTVIYADGGEYKTANGFSDKIGFNKSAIIYLDVNGRVAAIEYIDGGEYRLGLALEIKQDSDSEEVSIRILTADEKLVKIPFAKKVIIDGTQKKTYTAVYSEITENGCTLPYPVRYNADGDGRIINIDTPKESANEEGDNLVCRYSGSDKLYYKSTGTLSGHYVVADNTVIFSLPDVSGTSAENRADALGRWSEYKVNSADDLKNDTELSAKIYSVGDKGFMAAVMVAEGGVFASNYGNMAIVSQKRTAVNDDNEIVKVMELVQDGVHVTGFASQGTQAYAQIDSLNIGDVVRFSMSADGEYRGIKQIYRYADDTLVYYDDGNVPSYISMWKSSDMRFFKAKAYEISGEYIGLVDGSHTGAVKDTDIEAYKPAALYMYKVEGKKLTVNKASADDITEGRYNAAGASTVLIQTQYAQPQSMLIIE